MNPQISWLRVPRLTGPRMALALLVAMIIDGMQFLLSFFGPLEWAIVDPGLDLVGMALTNWLLGFHVLLLPSFVVKLIPVLEDLPTWTACVAAVIALRKREQTITDVKSAPPGPARPNPAAPPPKLLSDGNLQPPTAAPKGGDRL